ncbi:MAG TPA: hypothetical protein VGK32_24055 [Vicinamibacterales bacterium]|jgi:hypothetical protein
MKVLYVLPPNPAADDDLARRLEWVRRTHPGADIVLSSEQPAAGRYTETLRQPVAIYHCASDLSEMDAVVLVRGFGEPESAMWPSGALPGRLYVQERDGRLTLRNQPFNRADLPALDLHAFSRLAPRDQAGYYFFPYGYGVQWPGMGPVDSFGFRGNTDWLTLESRAACHKVVAVFGGSSTWSQACFPEESFPARLEARLNDWSTAGGLGLTFTVINLGLFGNVVLNEIINYVLFASRVKPDYVIAHDGFNDLLYGLVSDPWLLGEHSIAYQAEFEWWSQLLHGGPNEALTHRTEPFTVLNLPHVVVRAYVERKTQFRRMVEGAGSEFVWGFQPTAFSKAAMSPREAKISAVGHPQYDAALRKLPFLYEAFPQLARLPSDVRVVDAHRAFGRYGASDDLFYDYAHTTPAGDEKLAELYFAELTARMTATGRV